MTKTKDQNVKSDDDKGNIDYLAKYRGGDADQVTNAEVLTFVSFRPQVIGDHEFTHVSVPYALLSRVDYFDGRWGYDWKENADAKPKPGQRVEEMTLTYPNGRVVLSGCFLEKLHARILRREVAVIREAWVPTDEEVDAIRQQAEGKPIVFSMHLLFEVE